MTLFINEKDFSMKDRLMTDFKEAMKAKDSTRKAVITEIRGAIKNKEINEKIEVNENSWSLLPGNYLDPSTLPETKEAPKDLDLRDSFLTESWFSFPDGSPCFRDLHLPANQFVIPQNVEFPSAYFFLIVSSLNLPKYSINGWFNKTND